MNKFLNANKAFHHLHARILKFGVDFDDTKALFNVGFEIEDPMNNSIANSHYLKRNWKQEYAEAEWQWYLSGDNNIKKLGELYGKIPEIWRRMADKYGHVNSNYGYQWQRSDWSGISQLDYVVSLLKQNPKTRQAAISIYDGKEHDSYELDTPCTYAIQFTIVNGKLIAKIRHVPMLFNLQLLIISLICVLRCVLMTSGTVSATINTVSQDYS